MRRCFENCDLHEKNDIVAIGLFMLQAIHDYCWIEMDGLMDARPFGLAPMMPGMMLLVLPQSIVQDIYGDLSDSVLFAQGMRNQL